MNMNIICIEVFDANKKKSYSVLKCCCSVFIHIYRKHYIWIEQYYKGIIKYLYFFSLCIISINGYEHNLHWGVHTSHKKLIIMFWNVVIVFSFIGKKYIYIWKKTKKHCKWVINFFFIVSNSYNVNVTEF